MRELGPGVHSCTQLNLELDNKINESVLPYLEKVNFNSVKLALNKLKSGKSDISFDFNSDC